MVRGQKEITTELLKYIPAENLPQRYGGTCVCPNGCENSEYEEKLQEYVDLVNASAYDNKVDLEKELNDRRTFFAKKAAARIIEALPPKSKIILSS